MAREAGKGDGRRPTNHESFSSNYDLIWGKKVKHEQQETHRTHGSAPLSGGNNQRPSDSDKRAGSAHKTA
jgi:hypothetical protein